MMLQRIALSLFVLVTLHANAQESLTDKLPTEPRLKIGKLSNGLTYYIQKNTRPEKKVELRLVINAGSILEDDDQQGLAHFTEHMAFNGSAHFKKNDLVSFLQTIGVEFGADLNASTGFDETIYILPIPTDKKENIDKGFQILEDWASTVAFEGGEIDKERGVVLEESRRGKGAEDRMFRIVYPKMFEGSRYAQRLPIGKDDILKNFKYDVIRRFYRDWYRPDLMAVIVIGDLELAEAERLVKQHFEKLKNPAKERERVLTAVPARTKSEGIVVLDKEATNHVIEIDYGYQKSTEEVTVGDYRQSLVKLLFTSMLSQRMQELTQRADPPFVFGGSNVGGWARGYEAYQSFAYVGQRGVEPAIQALIQENERARKFGFTSGELDRVKKMLMKNIERSYNERDKTESEQIAEEYIRNFLEKEPIPGIANEFNYYKKFMDGITLEDVNAYATKTIPATDARKLVIFTGPEQATFKVPTNEELLAITAAAGTVELAPYEEKTVAASIMETPPKAGTIVGEKENKELGLWEVSLANGVKVILKPTEFKNDQVVMTAARFGGQYLYDPKDRFNAEFASTVVSQMGVAQFTPLDLRKVLAGKTASASPRLTTISETMNGGSSAVDVETMLQLTYLYFTQPRKDDELFKSFVTKQQALYQNMAADPQFTFQDSVIATLYKNQAWAPKLPKPENFAQINEDRALQIFKERYANANGFTFVLVGKFDLTTIKPLIATYLGSLPSSGTNSAFKDVGLRPVKGVVKKVIHKGTDDKSFIRMFWNGEAPYSEAELLKVQALTDILNIKIIESLREDLGGIYSGGMYGNLSKNPYNSYSLGVSLPCGPENVDKLIKATHAEIEKIKANGPLAADLEKVKETWKQQYQVNMKDNTFWARQLLASVETGSSGVELVSYEKRVAALTANDVKEAAKKYLDMKNYVEVVLNPEK
ncbi:MAG TPA: insulinase family protein [Chryseolinea sp.]|nr:insulinase family protein [Chryseolinea sp.]